MLNGTAILVVDLGNSSTKCSCKYGRDKNGKLMERRFELSNVFAPVPEGYFISQDYGSDCSTVLKVDTELNGQVVKGLFCNGKLQQKEFPLTTIKPSATSKKYNLVSSVLSIRLAIIRAYNEIMSMHRLYDASQLNLKWKIVTLLPPGDIELGASKLDSLIREVTSVDSILPEFRADVDIELVKVLPEGFCAYIGVVNETHNTFRKSHEFLANETVMIFDVGGGTTDCLVISNYQLVQNSKHTVSQGGNNVFQFVKYELTMAGIDLDADQLKEGILTGYVKDGAKLISISDIVNRAKEQVAQAIISDFQDYLERTGLKLRSVGYVLACGGGCINDSDDHMIKSLGDYLINNFKVYSPNAELVQLPELTISKVDKDGAYRKLKEALSPRELNLIGAGVIAEIL